MRQQLQHVHLSKNTNYPRGSSTKSTAGYVSKSNSIVAPNGVKMGKSLLPVQKIGTNQGYKFRTMFDNCSQSTFLSEETARKRNLRGIPVKYTLVCTDGREEEQTGQLYNLVLKDKNNLYIHIQAVGINKLSGKFAAVKAEGIEQIFPEHDVRDADVTRVAGYLDLLIGTDLAELHPIHVQTIQKLVLLKSRFDSGWTLFGHNDEVLESDGDEYDGFKANFVSTRGIKVLSTDENNEATAVTKANNVATKDIQFLDLISLESIGIDVPRKCNNCLGCKECKLSSQQTTYLESMQNK